MSEQVPPSPVTINNTVVNVVQADTESSSSSKKKYDHSVPTLRFIREKGLKTWRFNERSGNIDLSGKEADTDYLIENGTKKTPPALTGGGRSYVNLIFYDDAICYGYETLRTEFTTWEQHRISQPPNAEANKLPRKLEYGNEPLAQDSGLFLSSSTPPIIPAFVGLGASVKAWYGDELPRNPPSCGEIPVGFVTRPLYKTWRIGMPFGTFSYGPYFHIDGKGTFFVQAFLDSPVQTRKPHADIFSVEVWDHVSNTHFVARKFTTDDLPSASDGFIVFSTPFSIPEGNNQIQVNIDVHGGGDLNMRELRLTWQSI